MERLQEIHDLLVREDFAQALRRCEQLIQETGGRGEVALVTARALVGLARLQEAETWVQRARADLPDETVALRLLAQIYRRRGWRVRAQAIERRLSPPEDRTPLTAETPPESAQELAPPTPTGTPAATTPPSQSGRTTPITASIEAPQDRQPSLEPGGAVTGEDEPESSPIRASRKTPIPGPPPSPPGGQGSATASMSLPKLASTSLTDFPAHRPRPPKPQPSAQPGPPAPAPPEEPSVPPPPPPASEPSTRSWTPTPPAASPDAPGAQAAPHAEAPPQQPEGPDPLGLISEEEAANQRVLVDNGRRPALDEEFAAPSPPAPPREQAPAAAPTMAPEEPAATEPTPEPAAPEPTPEPPSMPTPAERISLEDRAAKLSYVDSYTARRKKSKLLAAVAVVLLAALAVAAVVVVRVSRQERLKRVLHQTQTQVDDVDYDGLKQARDSVSRVLGDSPNPNPTLTARSAQIELYLWMYYTGERVYLQQAQSLLEDSELRDPGGVETRFTRALWEGYLGDPSITLEVARDLEDSGIREDRVYLLRGVAASAMGDHGRAAKQLEQAVSRAPTCLNHLAFAREAERYGNLPDAQDQLEAILEMRPEHALARVDLALLRAGVPTERGYLAAVEAVQEEYNGKVPPRVMSRVFVSKARGYAAAGKPKDAATWFDQALAEDGENPDVLLAYGHELRVWGDLTEARAQLSKIEKHQPYSGDALGELGLIAYLQDRPAYLEEKLTTFPAGARKGAVYLLASGLHERMTGDPDQAVELIARTPPELWGGEARLLLADAQLEAGQLDDARGTLTEARELVVRYRGARDPLVSVADITAARIDVRAKKRPDQTRVDRALARHRRYPIVLYTSALLAEEQGDRKRAARQYKKAFERGQDFSLALVGFVHTAPGDDELLSPAARTYLRISPEGPHAAEMEKIVPR